MPKMKNEEHRISIKIFENSDKNVKDFRKGIIRPIKRQRRKKRLLTLIHIQFRNQKIKKMKQSE